MFGWKVPRIFDRSEWSGKNGNEERDSHLLFQEKRVSEESWVNYCKELEGILFILYSRFELLLRLLGSVRNFHNYYSLKRGWGVKAKYSPPLCHYTPTLCYKSGFIFLHNFLLWHFKANTLLIFFKKLIWWHLKFM